MEKNILDQYTEEIVANFKEYEKTGTIKWTYEIAAKDLPYQVGNLTKALMQLKGERHAQGLSTEQLHKNAADELADILAEVLFIAHELNIDIKQAWRDMLGSDAKKIEERSKAATEE